MNILPKKRWHVRTRENIARVRKDEQEAAQEAEEKKQRIWKAEQEARRTLLRERARNKYGLPDEDKQEPEQDTESTTSPNTGGHVNFFEELEEGKIVTTKTNAETELEEKEKREKYEKQIGYLTYLGQDTVETTGNIPWYDKVPDRLLNSSTSEGERSAKAKVLQDPLTLIRKYMPPEKKVTGKGSPIVKKKISLLDYQPLRKRKEKRKKRKSKKAKKNKRRKTKDGSSHSESETESESDSSTDSEEEAEKKKRLDQLRAERLKREKHEQERTEKLLARLQGKSIEEPKKEPTTPVVKQKYNSQYNPELAKQNFATSPRNR